MLPTDSRWAEASCGSVSFYDADGELLTTRYDGRTPERYKRTLKTQLVDEVNKALAQRPDLRLVKVADGASDNWSFFGKELPPGSEVLDFYHQAEHLKRAMDVIHGERSRESLTAYRKHRDILLKGNNGVSLD